MPRRRGNVQNDFRALRNQLLDGIAAIETFRPEILVVPDVLANRDAQLASIELKWRKNFGRFKIAVLVENVVGRQQALVRAPDGFSVLQNGGGIAEGASGTFGVPVHIPDAQGNRARLFRRFHERGEVGFDEIGAHEQVTRRIAAKKHFRRENELRAERAGFFIAGCKLLPVGRKITDGRIELENANFQCVESNRNRQFRNEFACAATRPPGGFQRWL